MSEEHVTAVFGPPWVRDRVHNLQSDRVHAERVILALRRRLRELDPTLPDVYDGTAWATFEEIW